MIRYYTDSTILEVESARIAIVSCLKCGAAILLDPRETHDLIDQHNKFHEMLVEHDLHTRNLK